MRDRSYTIGTDYVDNKTTNIIILNNNNNNINNHHHTYSGGKTSSILISSSVFLDRVNDDDGHMATTKTVGVTVNGQPIRDDGPVADKEDRSRSDSKLSVSKKSSMSNGDGKRKKFVSKTCISEPDDKEKVTLGQRSSTDGGTLEPGGGGDMMEPHAKSEVGTLQAAAPNETITRNGSLNVKAENSLETESGVVNGSYNQRKGEVPASTDKVTSSNGKISLSKEKFASLNGTFSASKEKLSAIGGKFSASREKLQSVDGKIPSSKEKITAINGKLLTSKDETSALKENELSRVVGTRLSSVSSNYSTTSSSTTSSKHFSSKDSPRLASISSTDSRTSASSKHLFNSKEKLSSTRSSCQSLTSQLKMQYPDVSGVAEKLSNLFCRRRTHTYHVQRRQKGLSLPPSFAETTGNWVTVANLRQLDGGILDPDDRLCDVVDDRDQIIAVYTEHPPPRGGGPAPFTDTAASSAAPSRSHTPDIFQESEHQFAAFNRTDIEVTGEELNNTPPPLHVRRGSEPTLNRLSPIPPSVVSASRGEGIAPSSHTVVGALKSSGLNKRWSAAPVIDDEEISPPSSTPLKDHDPSHPNGRSFVYPGEERGEGSGEEKNPSSSASSSASSHHSATNTAFSRFARDTNRCSIQVLSDNPAMSRWADAAERIGGSGMSYNEMRRRDPVGGASTSPHHSRQPSIDARHGKMHDPRLPYDSTTAPPCGPIAQKMYDVNGKEFVYGLQPPKTNDYQNLQAQHYGHARTQSTDGTVADGGVGVRSHSHDRQFDGRPFPHHERSHSHDSYTVERQQQQFSVDSYRQGHKDSNTSFNHQLPGIPGTPLELDTSRTSQDVVYGLSPLKHTNMERSRESTREERVLVVLNNGCGPLGIHVIPSPLMGRGGGNEGGLLVEGVEDGGRVAQDGRIQVHDRIVDINGHSLLNTTFHQAQEIFKDAMQAPALRLLVAKARTNTRRGASTNQSINLGSSSGSPAGAVLHPLTKQPPPTSLSARTQTVMLQSSSRRPGRHITLCLTKGQHGLGFSITTRDNPARGHAPIYIKSILPKGAAIEDGSLRIGDKLVSVNGKEVTGLGQTEVANMLRKVPVGGRAILEVSRQERGVEANTAALAGGGTASSARTGGPVGDGSAPQDGSRDRLKEDHPPSPQLPRQLGVEKAWEDSLMFPWKQREIITLDIPVHDSERAGLGVSVKGKTSSGSSGGAGGPVDLGIFVKNVIFGGAASRDGRLMENDQLVNINGLSLLGKPNSEAMNTLRVAMHQEGPVPGMITLTIARRVGTALGTLGGDGNPCSLQGSNSLPRSGRDSANSGASNSTGTETLGFLGGARTAPTTPTPYEGVVTDNNVTAHFNVTCSTPSGDPMTSVHHNPVLHRLTGNTAALRNDSYYQATHDTWNNSEMAAAMPPTPASRGTNGGGRKACVGGEGGSDTLGSPTVNQPSRDTLIIQDEYGPVHDGGYSQLSGGNNSCLDDTYNSQTSLDAAGGGPAGFSRDQFGRQSMSEKRHATLDAKSTDTYQRNKKAREERERMRQQMQAEEHRGPGRRTPPDLGPGLGMKKSSSLESLQTMVQEMTLSECSSSSRGGGSSRGGSGRVPRGRGCNESFRAAVDRSYDAPLAATEAAFMDTLAEEDVDGRPSLLPFGSDGDSKTLGHKASNNSKKNKGLLKGLGSMFRFGKHRKTLDNNIMALPESGDSDNPSEQQQLQPQVLQQQITQQLQQQIPQFQQYDGQDSSFDAQQDGGSLEYPVGATGAPEDLDSEGGCSRAERMHQLRAQHQRRHAQRNRTYPSDGAEEQYDERGAKRLEPVPSSADSQPLRSPPDEYGLPPHRPGSRGVRGAMHPPAEANSKQFAHYANYQQIKQHMRSSEQERLKQLASQQYRDFREKHHNSRECREYQSQRGPREGSNHSQSRPVSNYYEYESVQAIMTHAASGYGSASNAVAGGGGGRLEAAAPAALHNSSGIGLTPPHHQYQHHQQQHNNSAFNISNSRSTKRGGYGGGASINNTVAATNNYTSININNSAGGSSSTSSNINNSGASNNNDRNNSNGNKIVSNLNYNSNNVSTYSNTNPLSLSVHNSGNSRTIGYGSNSLLPDMANTGLHNSLPRRAVLHQHFADNLPIVTGTNMRQQQQHNAISNSKHSSKNQQQQYPPPDGAPFPLHKTQMMQAAAFHTKSGSSSSSNSSSQKGGPLYPPQFHSRHPPPPPPLTHAPTHRQQQHEVLHVPRLGGTPTQQVPGSKV